MALRLKHNELSLKIARRMVDEAYQKFPHDERFKIGSQRDPLHFQREAWFRERWSLTLPYVQFDILGGKSDEPSSRVLTQMPIEVWYRDPETGEMQQAEIPGKREGGFWAEWNKLSKEEQNARRKIA